MQGEASPALEEVYIGSEEVFFTSVGGCFEAFKRETCSVDASFESALAKAKSQVVPVRSGGDHDQRTVSMLFDCVPALEITGGFERKERAPVGLSPPLLKVPMGYGAVSGIRSGGRSALLCCDTIGEDGDMKKVWYRLKGCGNYVAQEGMRFPFPGLPVREVTVFGEVIGNELRGCSFPFSSLRELYMTDTLHEKCTSSTFPTPYGPVEATAIGNRSIGMWRYHLCEEDVPKGLKSALDELVDTPTSCTLFETIGEKRLEAHLIQGLCDLIDMGFLACVDGELALSSLKGRRRQSGEETEAQLESWVACCSGEDPCEPLDFSSSRTVPEGCLLHVVAPSTDARVPGIVPTRMEAIWKSSWALVNVESDKCKGEGASLVGQLAWRLGWECGDFSRLLRATDIMWGYFFDHNPFEPHCNSHSNNFIVIPPSDEPETAYLKRFLSPCDFDMAYTRAHFVSPYSSAPDDNLFDSWKETETVELARSLGGELVNSGVAIAAEAAQASHKASKFALRDTLLCGYREGLAGHGGKHSSWGGSTAGMQALITLSLICTHMHQS